jgi:two-component system response regulator TtrR
MTENDTTPHASGRVWIADDDDVRYSIRFALATHGLQAETFASGEEFFEHVDPSQTGCLVLDMTMSGMNGLEVQQRLRDEGSPIKVILLSGHATVRMAVAAMENGAVSFLEKPVDPEELSAKVKKALAESELAGHKAAMRAKLATFSKREAQIFDLICLGLKNSEIAQKLFLSQRTVEVHRAHIMKRLGSEPPIRILYELARRSLDESPLEVPEHLRKLRKNTRAKELPEESGEQDEAL